MSEFPVQCTIKPPAQYSNAPWLNFQAQDKDELEAQLREAFPTVEADSLSELVAKAFLEYGAVLTTAIGLSAPVPAQNSAPQAQPQAAPAVAPAAPSGPPAPQCEHGEKVFKDGQGKNGYWSAWMCRAEKNDPSKCKAVDAKTGRAWK